MSKNQEDNCVRMILPGLSGMRNAGEHPPVCTSIDDGFCIQVSQGNDTDSFGATAGSILGAFWGKDHLDQRWLAPFQDEIRTGLNFFPEHSLARLATRIGGLSARLRR